MAKKKFSVALKNTLIDSVELQDKSIMIQEISKDETHTYDLCKILSEFADVEGVSIVISFDSDIEEDE